MDETGVPNWATRMNRMVARGDAFFFRAIASIMARSGSRLSRALRLPKMRLALLAAALVATLSRGAAQSDANVTALISNNAASAMLRSDGSVLTWGTPGYGGNSSAVSQELSSGVVSLMSTVFNMVALQEDGSVVFWGDLQSDAATAFSAVQPQLHNVTNITVNQHAFAALRQDGSVVTCCGGVNGGDSSSVAADLSANVTRVIGAPYIGHGFVALKDNGAAVFWGNYGSSFAAVAQNLTDSVTDIVANGVGYTAIKNDGSAFTWGDNIYHDDVAEDLAANVSAVVATDQSFAALKDDGSVFAWGNLVATGGLAVEDPAAYNATRSGVASLHASSGAWAAHMEDGSVVTFGDPASGGEVYELAGNLTGGVLKVYSCHSGFAALKAGGELITWGDWQLSDEKKKALASGVVDVHAVWDSFVAMKSSGQVLSWGNTYGIVGAVDANGNFLMWGHTNEGESIPVPTSYTVPPTQAPTPAPTPAPTTAPTMAPTPTRLTNDNIQWAVYQWTSNRASAIATYGNISDWDVSAVTDMATLVENEGGFNDDISGWDVSSVTTMQAMFNNADAFNQDIGSWNTSSVRDMGEMFMSNGVHTFNQDIGGWDTSNVTNMENMFHGCESFNQDIGGWDVSRVTNMRWMFRRARVFNGDIRGWDTRSVTNMYGFLQEAEDFSHTLCWDLSSLTTPVSNTFYDMLFSEDCSDCVCSGSAPSGAPSGAPAAAPTAAPTAASTAAPTGAPTVAPGAPIALTSLTVPIRGVNKSSDEVIQNVIDAMESAMVETLGDASDGVQADAKVRVEERVNLTLAGAPDDQLRAAVMDELESLRCGDLKGSRCSAFVSDGESSEGTVRFLRSSAGERGGEGRLLLSDRYLLRVAVDETLVDGDTQLDQVQFQNPAFAMQLAEQVENAIGEDFTTPNVSDADLSIRAEIAIVGAADLASADVVTARAADTAAFASSFAAFYGSSDVVDADTIEVQANPCIGISCSGHGTCDSGVCACVDGWTGDDCATETGGSDGDDGNGSDGDGDADSLGLYVGIAVGAVVVLGGVAFCVSRM